MDIIRGRACSVSPVRFTFWVGSILSSSVDVLGLSYSQPRRCSNLEDVGMFKYWDGLRLKSIRGFAKPPSKAFFLQ